MSGKRQKIQYSLALESVARGETPVSDHQGAEPLVAKPVPESPALQAQPDRTAAVRDPYARWCGRGGTVRCPPIPIFGQIPSKAVRQWSAHPGRTCCANDWSKADIAVSVRWAAPRSGGLKSLRRSDEERRIKKRG